MDLLIEQSGSLEFKAVLMARQGADNYRKVITSNSKIIKITVEELEDNEGANLKPEGVLLSPRVTNLARATARLTDITAASVEGYGELESITMENIGEGYDPNDLPIVNIVGGGGTGGEAQVVLVNGAINELIVESFGENYLEFNKTHWDSIIPVDPPNGSDFNAYVKVSNGVLEEMQTVANGAIAKPGLGYGDILNLQGWVRIFDYNQGSGATGYVSKVGENGEILEITVDDGGRNYESNTSVIFIVKEYNGYATNGYGFESGSLKIKDGIANDYVITNHGTNYSLNKHLVNVSRNSFGVWQSSGSSSIKVNNSKFWPSNSK